MDISIETTNVDSEAEFSRQFLRLVDSGAGVIHVRASEVLRVVSVIRKTAILDEGVYNEWDVVNGTRMFTLENFTDEALAGDGNLEFNGAFQAPKVYVDGKNVNEHVRYYVYVNPQMYVENNPFGQQLMLNYNEYLPIHRVCVVLVTPDEPLPECHASKNILTLRMATPSVQELRDSLDAILSDFHKDTDIDVDMTDDQKQRICYSGAGLSLLQFETYVSLGTVIATRGKEPKLTYELLDETVKKGKTDVVNSSDILELYPSANIDDVGGMENLKDWVRRRANCYSDDARQYGIEAPKGAVLVGPPGTGKSLVAKAVSGVLGVPLVRMDFGRVFSSLVGSSEQRIRQALHMVEAMSPCVLFCDEIDKGLGGIAGGSGGDSGVSMRVLGSFLTWLNDNQYPVFCLVTANNINGLPPELMRRGRFDAIFSTRLPDEDERRDILAIHLRKRNRDIEDYEVEDVNKVVRACAGYVPAEIESAVKDALVDAYSEGVDLTMSHIEQALKVMVPLSKAYAQQIKAMEDWAKTNATPVSYTQEQRTKLGQGDASPKVRTTRTRLARPTSSRRGLDS